MNFFVKKIKQIRKKLQERVNRSFRLTKRRDLTRELDLPGFFKFNNQVISFILKNRKIFLSLVLFSSISAFLLFGMSSQENYSKLVDTMASTSGDFFDSAFGKVESAGILFAVAVSGGISPEITEAQQIFAVIVMLITWLTTVWLSRNILAGNKVKLRDGLYSAGSPIIATLCLVMLAFVQLIPVGIAGFGYSAAAATGLLNGGVEAMMFWMAAAMLTLLSLSWLTSTFFALIIITIPGVYPMKALSVAKSLVFGRRIRIMMRLIWLSLSTFLGWVIVLLPVILIDMLIRKTWSGVSSLPIIPVLILAMSSATVVWFSVYIYMLYRKIVDNESK